MSRIARERLNASFFHVMCQGINKEMLFNLDKQKEKYLFLLKENMFKFDIQIIAYCIMSNHVHILIYSEDMCKLSKFMKCVNTEYAQYYNYIEKRVGYVFRDRFKSQAITDKKYLYQCINYIHLNPVKAGMVALPQEYIYSSYNDYMSNSGITQNKIFGRLFDGKNFAILENFSNCSDFIDENIDKNTIMDEYICNFIKKNKIGIECIFSEKKYLCHIIKTLLRSTCIRKKDIGEKFGMTWKWINTIVNE
ncbi:MAG: transposase [Clostridia bacterium]|nr:transposase [Clostridia bacterium]